MPRKKQTQGHTLGKQAAQIAMASVSPNKRPVKNILSALFTALCYDNVSIVAIMR